MNAQQTKKQDLPYHQIPEPPSEYSSGTIISRMIDGLGYRYYWATEGLTKKDLEFKPSEDSRNSMETIEHLYGLSDMILNSARKVPNVRPQKVISLSFEELRAKTLINLKGASQLFLETREKDIQQHLIIFSRENTTTEFPLWNLLNGPLADALYHTGQIVSFRRVSGNPINPGVNVFLGKTKS